ncbi:hypothetical protein [Butyricimonas paravirosa]
MKIKRITKVWIIALVAGLFLACVREKGDHQFITFINHSEDAVHISLKRIIKIKPSDTLYNCNQSITSPIEVGDSCQFIPTNYFWETDFKWRSYIQIFVFPASIFTYNDDGTRDYSDPSFCENTIKYQLKRYQLTEDELDSEYAKFNMSDCYFKT